MYIQDAQGGRGRGERGRCQPGEMASPITLVIPRRSFVSRKTAIGKHFWGGNGKSELLVQKQT